MRNDKENIVVEKSFQFALKVIVFCELLEEKRKFILAGQLFKSGTSIEANIREAQNAESKADFIHKMKIAAKEADEAEYWLMLCKYSTSYPFSEEPLIELSELIKILGKIISSSKKS